MTNLSFLNATSNLLSSTTMSGLVHNNRPNKMISSSIGSNYYISSLIKYKDSYLGCDISWEDDYFGQDEYDNDDSCDSSSDTSHLSTWLEDENNSFNFLNPSSHDLNSSISSVSSLEYEPFEMSVVEAKPANNPSSSIRSNKSKKLTKTKSINRSKFDPLISSSRSNVTIRSAAQSKVNPAQSKRKMSFEPFTTSSRRSLFNDSKQPQPNQMNCSYCCDSNQLENFNYDDDENNNNCFNSTKSSNYLLYDQNICSSTLCSIKMKEFVDKNDTIMHADSNQTCRVKQSISRLSSNSSISNSSFGSIVSLS
jgi:hypothetical protein